MRVAGTSVAPGRAHTYVRTHVRNARMQPLRLNQLCEGIRTDARSGDQPVTYVREFAWAMSDPADFSQSCNRIGPVHEGEYTDDATEVEGPPNLIWHNHEVGTQVSPEDFGNDVGAPPVSCTTALGDDTCVEAVGVLSEGPSNDVVTAVGPKGIDNDVNGQPASPAATWLATPPDAHVYVLCYTYVRTCVLFHLLIPSRRPRWRRGSPTMPSRGKQQLGATVQVATSAANAARASLMPCSALKHDAVPHHSVQAMASQWRQLGHY